VSEGLLIALIVAALIVCGFVVFALVELVRTLRSVRTLADELTGSVPPLIAKADVTVDALNVELLRVDTIIGEVEVLSSKVGHTVNVVQDAVNLPATAVGTAGERIRTAWHRVKRNKAAETGPTDDL